MSRLLVCPPDYFTVAYEINSWMHLERSVDCQLARVQWDSLMSVLEKDCGATLERMAPVKNLPDLVFTANAGVVAGRKVALSRFRFPQRQLEEPYFERWFHEHGYEVERLPDDLYFEGAGDLLGMKEWQIGGYLQRTDIKAYERVASVIGCRIIPVGLIDTRFYHLDTCFCPLPQGDILWFPAAFDEYGQAVIKQQILEGRHIVVPEAEALRFACNAVCVNEHVVVPDGCPVTMERLAAHGYEPHAVSLTEFLKAGGAAKCLTLALD